MKGVKIFIDTNILVYAHDKDGGRRHVRAKEIVLDLWEQKAIPSISIQVLQEFYVNLCKKNVSLKEARELVEDYLAWDVIENNASLLAEGVKNDGEAFSEKSAKDLLSKARARSGVKSAPEA